MKKLQLFEVAKVYFAGKVKTKDFESDSRSDHPNWSMAILMSLDTLIKHIGSTQMVPVLSEPNFTIPG